MQVGLVVANCSGWSTDSAVLSAINYVTKDCATRNHPGLGVTKKCVADFGIVYDRVVTYIDKAIDKSIKSGVVYAVPAGWRSVDACTSSPGSVTAALTVGALDWRGQPAWYSNYGPCECQRLV